jgi:hypothetical protein
MLSLLILYGVGGFGGGLIFFKTAAYSVFKKAQTYTDVSYLTNFLFWKTNLKTFLRGWGGLVELPWPIYVSLEWNKYFTPNPQD